MSEAHKYDVAFSFRARDLPLAEQLRGRLAPLNCFVYAGSQDVVAATDGMDTFRGVFKEQSKLNVVLFRDGWGSTPWTGIEEIAIKDSCLNNKFGNLVFARLDNANVPDWLPDTHQLFDLTLYSLDELVGVIKSRAQARGAIIRTETGIEKARRLADVERTAREERQYLDSAVAVRAALNSLADIKSALAQQAGEASKTHPELAFRFGSGNPSSFDFIFAGIRIRVDFNHFSNSVRDCFLNVEFLHTQSHRPHLLDGEKLLVAHIPGIGICWKPDRGAPIVASQVADRWLTAMVDHRERLRNGS